MGLKYQMVILFCIFWNSVQSCEMCKDMYLIWYCHMKIASKHTTLTNDEFVLMEPLERLYRISSFIWNII